jgi:hypothetical protein
MNEIILKNKAVVLTPDRNCFECRSEPSAGIERKQGRRRNAGEVAAKMPVIAWALWKNEEVFQGRNLLQ